MNVKGKVTEPESFKKITNIQTFTKDNAKLLNEKTPTELFLHFKDHIFSFNKLDKEIQPWMRTVYVSIIIPNRDEFMTIFPKYKTKNMIMYEHENQICISFYNTEGILQNMLFKGSEQILRNLRYYNTMFNTIIGEHAKYSIVSHLYFSILWENLFTKAPSFFTNFQKKIDERYKGIICFSNVILFSGNTTSFSPIYEKLKEYYELDIKYIERTAQQVSFSSNSTKLYCVFCIITLKYLEKYIDAIKEISKELENPPNFDYRPILTEPCYKTILDQMKQTKQVVGIMLHAGVWWIYESAKKEGRVCTFRSREFKIHDSDQYNSCFYITELLIDYLKRISAKLPKSQTLTEKLPVESKLIDECDVQAVFSGTQIAKTDAFSIYFPQGTSKAIIYISSIVQIAGEKQEPFGNGYKKEIDFPFKFAS